jgi:hypothetical protein
MCQTLEVPRCRGGDLVLSGSSCAGALELGLGANFSCRRSASAGSIDFLPSFDPVSTLPVQAPRKQLASKAARKSAPSTGGVKKPHRFR